MILSVKYRYRSGDSLTVSCDSYVNNDINEAELLLHALVSIGFFLAYGYAYDTYDTSATFNPRKSQETYDQSVHAMLPMYAWQDKRKYLVRCNEILTDTAWPDLGSSW